MKDYNLSNTVLYESGIYYNSKETRSAIDGSTRRTTIKRRLMRKLRDEHFMASKIKIALCIFGLVAMLATWLVG